ncbi:MAG: response regulator, partial [Rhodospirillaceae bacterium]|nr:response regulator [Rhodospirillaceae bacterium]
LLQVVAGNIALLEENVPSDLVTGRSFDAINRNVTRGADLTSRLLSFSRQQPLAPKALVIDKILAEMQELLRQTLGETIEVKIGSVKGIWIAEADPGQLESALLNLALNARDAMPGGGIITLSADNIQLDERMAATHEEEASGDYVMLSLADNGSGMSEDDISHAFEPFFTTKDVGKGTGLGLSMVYGFAQQSGGFVEIESELGSGTTMRLYLPRLVGTKEDEAATQGALLEAAATADGTILLVEDDADVRESLAAQLTSLGYRVIEAEDGTAALAALSDAPNIDLLFTDVVMPGGLSGVELARRTLALRPELKILYSTGYSEEFIVEAGDMPDSAIVLRKPYDKSKLAATIAQTLN